MPKLSCSASLFWRSCAQKPSLKEYVLPPTLTFALAGPQSCVPTLPLTVTGFATHGAFVVALSPRPSAASATVIVRTEAISEAVMLGLT